jgi:hypothetical protein
VTSRVALGALIVSLLSAGAAFAQAPLAVAPPTVRVTVADAIPDSHGIKRMVVLRGLDKITGRAIDVNAPVGMPVRFGSLSITARYCYTVPPEEPPETTAFLQIDETKAGTPAKRMFSGWMFASTPALNALEHPVYDVWVINCKTEEPAPAADAPPPERRPGSAPLAAPARTGTPPGLPKP